MPIEVKPPAATNKEVTFTVPKAKYPYFVEWFQDTNTEGLTVSQFLEKLLTGLVRQHFLRKAINEDIGEIAQTNESASAFLEE